MKVSDYIADFIAKASHGHVFLMTGGAVAHIVDSLGKKMDENKVEYICIQHEQAGAMAAEAYSRFSSGIGVMVATSGPGATNLLTGICGCWFDSIPCLFITGQVSTSESLDAVATHPRQVGFQETDIVSIVRSVTKFAVKVTNPYDIRLALEKAVSIAQSNRPGPVLVDIPTDIQAADIDPSLLKGFDLKPDNLQKSDSTSVIQEKIQRLMSWMADTQRPIIILGAGIHKAKLETETLELIEKLNFPVVASWGAFDIIPHSHPQFVGHFGIYGNRGANFSIQNADLILSLGSRLDTRQTGGKVSAFGRAAKKIMVDIDHNEIEKGRGLSIDLGICADLQVFFSLFQKKLAQKESQKNTDWLKKTRRWHNEYPAVLEQHFSSKTLNPYAFLRILSDLTPENEVVVADEGGHLVWTMQSWQIKKNQRLFSTFGNSPMGYALPAAIGACLALNRKQILCIDGDGGFQLNIQELQTLVEYKLPIKIFIINNHCYGIIKQFQDQHFSSRYEASGRGYSSPNFMAIAEAYKIKALSISSVEEAKKFIPEILSFPGPILCNVEIDHHAQLNPKLEFGRPLEDSYPYLSDAEFNAHMIIPSLPRDTVRGWKAH